MKCTTSVRVRYAETDQMGVVYHGNYFAWFEMGRADTLREAGLTYQRMEAEEGCSLPVVEVSCRYRRPARYDEQLQIETTVKAMRGSIVIFAYRLYRGEELLAEGETKHVAVDRSMKPRRLPPAYREAMLRFMGESETQPQA